MQDPNSVLTLVPIDVLDFNDELKKELNQDNKYSVLVDLNGILHPFNDYRIDPNNGSPIEVATNGDFVIITRINGKYLSVDDDGFLINSKGKRIRPDDYEQDPNTKRLLDVGGKTIPYLGLTYMGERRYGQAFSQPRSYTRDDIKNALNNIRNNMTNKFEKTINNNLPLEMKKKPTNSLLTRMSRTLNPFSRKSRITPPSNTSSNTPSNTPSNTSSTIVIQKKRSKFTNLFTTKGGRRTRKHRSTKRRSRKNRR